MKTLLNSNLLPILSVGMYNTFLDSGELFDSYTIDQDLSEGYIDYDSDQFWNGYDNNKYVQHIQKLADKFYSDSYTSGDITIKIKCGEIYSPREYNFATDNIDLTVTYPKAKLLKFAEKHCDEFSKFLYKNYSSYDGFVSFGANNYTEWRLEFLGNEDIEVGAIIRFWFETVNETEQFNQFNYEYSFYEYVSENTFYSEFYVEPVDINGNVIREIPETTEEINE